MPCDCPVNSFIGLAVVSFCIYLGSLAPMKLNNINIQIYTYMRKWSLKESLKKTEYVYGI